MSSPRWLKLYRDVRTERGRILSMIAAITVSLIGLGTLLGAYSVLTREISGSYMGTLPASATLEVPSGVDAKILQKVRRHPLVAEAEAREVVVARAKVGDDWRRLLLFVVDDFTGLRLNRFTPKQGAWPPPAGTLLIEQSALGILETSPGASLLVKPPHGTAQPLRVSGIVHDPGLAPAWQERSGYGYITRDTLTALGESAHLGELRIVLASHTTDLQRAEAEAAEVAQWLERQGHDVEAIQVPPPAQHPHQKQMSTMLLMMLCFSGMTMVLSAILVASSLSALLARQVREIGVMKAVGARARQIAGMYLVFVGLLGAVSVVLALPLGLLGADLFAGAISNMLNFTLANRTIPGWVFAVELMAGTLVPLGMAAVPIFRASRISVRQAIDEHGVSPEVIGSRRALLPRPLRNAARRPARLALTLSLLAAGGAMFMTAFNVKEGWTAIVGKVYETRNYDVEIRLQAPELVGLADRVGRLPGVKRVESWGLGRGAFSQEKEFDIVHTYPDRGHGSLLVMAPPAETTLVHFPVRSGRWLSADDTNAVVLNHVAAAQVPGVAIGREVALSLEGRHSRWRVVGIVEEVGSPATAYVAPQPFAAITGTAGRTRMLRVATDATNPTARLEAIRHIEGDLMAANIGVESAIPLAELRTAVGDHILILVRSLVGMAVVLGVVGTLGLGTAMSVSVVERTRELAVMRTLGATPRRIVRQLVSEGLIVGGLSFFLALLLSAPLTLFVGRLVGNLGFLLPLSFVISHPAAVIWIAVVLLVSYLATLLPARRAASLVIREALAHS